MRFIDEAVITVQGGGGGHGVASFHREPYVPKGGPDGGNGGRGGDVALLANPQLATLEDVTLNRRYIAPNGKPGGASRRTGRSGADLVIELPVGTLVRDADNGEVIADLVKPGERVVVASGGRGGRGNASFATSRNRAPRRADPGSPGEERRLRLELKLLADVGLVGRPNAGKSTLLKAISRANPEVAAYPFTTLSPALGVVDAGNYRRIVMADIPGLAQGAAEGRGLGHRFLRHIERTRLIVMLIEAPEKDYQRVYEGLADELERFNPELGSRQRLVVLSKADLPRGCRKSFPFDLEVSGLTGEGVVEFVKLVSGKMAELEREGF